MRFKRWVVNIACAMAGVCLLLSFLYFWKGSLEMFPTEEQHEKARLAAVFLIIVFTLIEAVLLSIRRKLGQLRKKRCGKEVSQ